MVDVARATVTWSVRGTLHVQYVNAFPVKKGPPPPRVQMYVPEP